MKHILRNLHNLDNINTIYSNEELNAMFDIDTMEPGKQYTSFVEDNAEATTEPKAIRFTTEGTAYITLNIDELPPSLQYSMNGTDWESWDGRTITKGETLYLRGLNPYGMRDSSFVISGDAVECHGNIMYLLDYENELDTVPAWAFYNLFSECDMLTTTPELPAKILESNCYDSMFYKCTSLVNAPELPATTLDEGCYNKMFYGCTALETAPKELPAETLAEECYVDMFYNCSSLVTTPELPAETLAPSCYFRMFRGCTKLTTAPELPAKTLAEDCYKYMFYGCTSLKQITCLYTEDDLFDYTSNWVKNVPAGGIFYASKDRQWTEQYGASYIPVGWNIEDIQ